MFCNKCGSPLPDGANFCRVCGQSTSSTVTAAPPPIPPGTESTEAPPPPPSPMPSQAFGTPLAAEPQTNGKALGSLISGIVGLTFLPILASIVAVILGHISLSEIKKSAGRLRGEGMAIAGLVMGYLGFAMIPLILIIAAIAIPNLLRARMVANETSAVATVRSVGTAETAYSAENPETGFTCSIDELKTTAAGGNSANIASTRSGYNFYLRDCESNISDGPVLRYKFVATPIVFNNTGAKTYCTDETGIIKYVTTDSADACLTDGVPLD